MIWWEKTVEYLFIQRYASKDGALSPLDGSHERAGDALSASGNKWTIIEFKRDEGSFRDEKKKFVNFDEARDLLSDRGKHHLLVYGYESGDDIALGCKGYFSGTNIDIGRYSDWGTDQKSFMSYLDDLLRQKKQPSDASKPGGGGSGSGGFSSVAIIAKNESLNKVCCLSLGEYQEYRLSRRRGISI